MVNAAKLHSSHTRVSPLSQSRAPASRLVKYTRRGKDRRLAANPGGTAKQPFVPDVDEGIFC
jgi:hypothetical protein